jgi:hypothetical protein
VLCLDAAALSLAFRRDVRDTSLGTAMLAAGD